MAIVENLSSGFVSELMAYALRQRDTFEIAQEHLKYQYLQTEAEKKLWQFATRYYQTSGRIPTFGQLQQHFNEDDKALDYVLEVASIETEDDGHGPIIDTFQEYLKQMMFLDANERITDLYNRGKKDDSYRAFMKAAEDFQNFSLRDSTFESVYADFDVRQAQRTSADWSALFKVPTGIDELDDRLGGASGGCESGELCLVAGESGRGKSQFLAHIGITASRLGYHVAHFQLEGTRQQCMDRYDAAWTGTLYRDMKTGALGDAKYRAISKVMERMINQGVDIHVQSSEKFGGKSIPELRNDLNELRRKYGKVDVIVIDYMELLKLGDGAHYGPDNERLRQRKIMEALKELAMEFNAVLWTATQCSNVPYEKRCDPAFVITRDYLSEDKGKLNPADLFMTMNQTPDEQNERKMRLHTDKIRQHGNTDGPMTIATNFSHARFYDRKRTMALLEDDDE